MHVVGAERLANLGDVTVRGRLVGTHRATALRVMAAGALAVAALAGTRLYLDHGRFDDPRPVQR